MISVIADVRRKLRELATPEAAAAFRKFVPTAREVHGVRVPLLNDLARQYRAGGFQLVADLCESGAFEEQLLAAKLVGKLAKKNPREALLWIASAANTADNWAVCDTFATEAVRPIAEVMRDEVLGMAEVLVFKHDEWPRRFGLVLLTNYARDPGARETIDALIEAAAGDKRHYVKKAVDWLRRDLAKAT